MNESSLHGSCLTSFQRKLLEKSLDKKLTRQYRQRIEIMLLADEGKTQTQIREAIGCSLATARYWIFIAQSGQAQQWKNHPIGRPQEVNEQYLERLKELLTNSPKKCGYAFERWTANCLGKHLAKEFGVEFSDRHINRLIKKMGLSTKTLSAQTDETISQNAKRKNIAIRDLTSEQNVNSDLETLTFNTLV
ncbi:MAG: winged helix-turn-helix domain-containing protein, partial [Trichodesmium sp. St18_bin3_1_1]|nr:winged helix-turn-helix domain-containing protein [Trichodesmium sp. St18_bin3_1_1]